MKKFLIKKKLIEKIIKKTPIGLSTLINPLLSEMEFSNRIIEKIGASSMLPGFTNQNEHKQVMRIKEIVNLK